MHKRIWHGKKHQAAHVTKSGMTLAAVTGNGRTSWLSQRETLSGLGLPVFRYAGLVEQVEGDDIDAENRLIH